MEKPLSALFILILACLLSANSFAARKAEVTGLCSKTVSIGGYIYKNYQPLRRDPHDHTLKCTG